MFKTSTPFRFGLGISIVLVLMSLFGGAPAKVEAAPKPSHTPRPTRTARPTKTAMPSPTFTSTSLPTDTPTSLPTFTFTATFTSIPTDTPTNTPTFTPTFTYTPTSTDLPTDTPTATLTATATATPCALVGVISPPGGDKVPRLYTITASDANDCGVPLNYYWRCTSPNNPWTCNDFTQLANAGGNTTSSAPLFIAELEEFTIELDICELNNPSNCAPTTSFAYTWLPLS